LSNDIYSKVEALDKLIKFSEPVKYGVYESVSGKSTVPFAPEKEDLVRLHKLIRKRKPFTVLEFGVGYSTFIIADALHKNKSEWENLRNKPGIRNRFMFKLFSIDASLDWIENVKKDLPQHLLKLVNFHYSEVEASTYNGQLCHFYKTLPDIVPEFIYLDGPHPKDVKGTVRGLSFKCDERTVMAADLLLMESTFLPGLFILVDGRTNNARFLERNFTRSYKVFEDEVSDVTTFELVENRLGKLNVLGFDLY
jgi:hypothetical protein